MAVEHTRLLLALNEQDASTHKVAALTTQAHEVDQLREQVTKLTKQVAALSNTSRMLENSNNHQDASTAAAMVTTNVTVHFAAMQGTVIVTCATHVDSQDIVRQCSENDQGLSVKGARYSYSQ